MASIRTAGPPHVRSSAPPAAFDEFFRGSYVRLVHLAMGFTGSRAEAEEVVQEAFAATATRWVNLHTHDDAIRWTRRVLVNLCISRGRRRQSEARAMVRLGPVQTTTEDVPAVDAELWRAVRELPDQQAAAVALVYLEDLSFAQVGEVLGCSAETARTHLRRAHATLAKRLGSSVDTIDVAVATTEKEVGK
jgi:RNA polymerase sigma-70 factor, ECF subfamily